MRLTISLAAVVPLAALLAGCSHLSARLYSETPYPPTAQVEVFHQPPTRSYMEIAEISDEGIEEPTLEIITKGKSIGADGVYFLRPEETGKRAMYAGGGRSILRYRAIAFKWK